MRDDDSHRRYLIAVGITTDLPRTGSRIVDSVSRMTRIFTANFGYERVTSLDIDPALDQVRKEIREFCLKRQPDDVVALYYTGHADEVNETHRIWTGGTVDSVAGTLETKLLAELMLVGTPLRFALIILDTCFAAKGGAEALRASVPSMGEGKTLALLTAAYPREQIVAGDFARLFQRAVDEPSVAGHEPPYLSPLAIASAIGRDKSRPGWQTVSHSLLGGKIDLPFFPNPRYDRQLHGLDLLTQLRIEQQELRVDDLRVHFLPRARGADVPAEFRWRFVGREAALRDLVNWLENIHDLSVRVVTGGPGSGKSAVISRLVVLSEPDWRRMVPVEGLAADTIPPEGSIATGIHARGLTSAQVLAAVCAAAGVPAETPTDLLREMRGRRFTVAIDAIDEALDPRGLISTILRPLVEAGPAQGLRLLLGTRPHLLNPLGTTGITGSVIDLDDDDYADPLSLREYVVRGLEVDNLQSPYHSASEDLVADVAKAVANAAGHSFLVALIVSRTLLNSTEIPDPGNPVWRASLPGTAAAAMHSDLETRLGAEADRARDLLRPLAFAHGAGLPWEDLWAPLSSKLSGRDYSDDDLIWLRRQAGSYVVEAMESGHSVYRLYHAALAEYLRQGCNEGQIHNLFFELLMGRVPTSRSGPDWSRAHPYVLAHLATHAQRAGKLDGLLVDPGYLVNAVPTGLLAALPAARDPEAELAGRAYQRAVHQLRDQPEDYRFSYLELAARIAHAAELAGRIAVSAPHRRWSVPWTHWPPEHPHRVLAGHLGSVNGVVCLDPGDGNRVVASIGHDAKLRIWDAVTAEPRGTYTVGEAPLVAVRAVRLPGGRTVLVLLAADRMLHTWDTSTAALLRTVPVTQLWRRLAFLRNASLTLECVATPDGQQFALVGGHGIRTSLWDLSSGRRVAAFPALVTPGAIEFRELINGRTVIAASRGGVTRWMCDLQTGQELPYERRRIPFAWLRSWYDNVTRASQVTYYALRGGPPVVAVRFFRRTVMVWDLTVRHPLGIWQRGGSDATVRLANGQVVSLPLPKPKISASQLPAEDHGDLVRLGAPAQGPSQSDHESRESLSLRCEMRGRFVRVEFRDYLEKPDPGLISLTLAGHAADLTGYDWDRLPDGHVIVVTASLDGTVRRWDISSIRPGPGEEEKQARVGLHRIASVPLEGGTSLGLTISDDIGVALWDLETGKLAGGLDTRQACALSIARPPGHSPVAVTFDTDQTMQIWSLPDGSQTGRFPADPVRWPSDAAAARLPDGTCIVVTTGHGRKAVVWDLATGRIRNVLTGHKGWSACVTCADGSGLWPLALTGGLDNRVNVWNLRRGRRADRFRIVPPWTSLIHPSAGQAHAVRAMPLDSGTFLVLVATSDGTVKALEPRGFRLGARRAGTVPAQAVGTATLSDGQAVVVTATDGGTIRIWKPEAFTRRGTGKAPLCEINIEVPVNDISTLDNDTFVFATPNGLTAVRLDAILLKDYACGS